MIAKFYPSALKGDITMPVSKAHFQRLLICNTLAGEPVPVLKHKYSNDIEDVLRALAVIRSEDAPVVTITESGAALRFLLPVCAALKDEAFFLCGSGLAKRPMEPLLRALQSGGTHVDIGSFYGLPSELIEKLPEDCDTGIFKEGCLYHLKGKLRAGDFFLPGDVSSQYASGLLMAAPVMDGSVRIHVSKPVESYPYIDLTRDVMVCFMANTELHETDSELTLEVNENIKYRKLVPVSPECDWTIGALYLVAGSISEESDINITGLSPSSHQGDSAILDILNGDIPFEYDASGTPDLVPILAVLACSADGESRITGCRRLRYKESDRLETVCRSLSLIGADITATGDDTIVVRGHRTLSGGEVPAMNDHRIVMALAAASGICGKPVVIHGAEAVNKSYPGFFDDWRSLGGKLELL